MTNKIAIFGLCLSLSLISPHTRACAGHFSFDPEGAGFLAGALIRMVGLAPPEQVFKVKHLPATKAVIGEDSEITVEYERPWFSKNVHLRLVGSNNVELLDEDIELPDHDGAVTARYRLNGKGFDSITITVSGEHRGETLHYSSRVYVRAKETETDQLEQVTAL